MVVPQAVPLDGKGREGPTINVHLCCTSLIETPDRSSPYPPCTNDDLQLLESLKEYQNIYDAISETTLPKVSNHLRYLSEKLPGFDLLDLHFSIETKAMMVKAMREQLKGQDSAKRVTLPMNSTDIPAR